MAAPDGRPEPYTIGPDGRADLGRTLEALYRGVDAAERLRADPVAFVHRYTTREDQELAGVLASCLAFGRVAAFRPVLDQVFALADARGGPRAWVEGFDPQKDGDDLRPLYYRWSRGSDLVLLVNGLKTLLARGPSLEAHLGASGGLPDGLAALIDVLRAATVDGAAACGVRARAFGELPRGTRVLLPSPADGSACKRWFMFLRWMIRPPREGIDLGLWTARSPAELVVPLDTHVLRIAQFVGLTRRRDDSLRTALEVTDGLRRLDPQDPVRFDFAIAHLGISGACRGRRDPEICPGCALAPVCTAS